MSLRIGIIGLSLERGWAAISHLPAIKQLKGITLAGVSARDQRKADALAEAVGAQRGFSDARAMAADPSIDSITVAVRVPCIESWSRPRCERESTSFVNGPPACTRAPWFLGPRSDLRTFTWRMP